MIWKERGVCEGSYTCFFDASENFREYYYYIVRCGYFQCNQDYCVKDRGTRSPIFFYIIDGELQIEYEGKHSTARANDVVLINCFHPQKYYCDSTCEFMYFHYDGNLARLLTDELIHQNGGPVFQLENHSQIYHNINEPIMRLCYQDQISEAFLSSMVYSTLCLIQEQKDSLASDEPESGSTSEKVIRYINRNLQNKITLKELADYAGLSPYYFSRLFKKETGHSPLEYVALSKINYSKLMLRTSKMPISEIAETLGYSSTASYINAFKARRGLTPKKYRDVTSTLLKNVTEHHE